MTTNERRYLQMLLRDEDRKLEVVSWIVDKRCSDTSIYLQWLRDGKTDWIQDDNNRILEQRRNNHEGRAQ